MRGQRGQAGRDTFQASIAGYHSPAVATGPRGNTTRATDTSVATASGVGTLNTDDLDIKLIYSEESDNASDSKASPPAIGSPGADTADPDLLALVSIRNS